MSTLQRALSAKVRPRTFLLLGACVYTLFLIFYHTLLGAPWHQGFNSTGWWQFLPEAPLRDHPLQSILYLHARLPAENLLKAVGLHSPLGDGIFALVNHVAAAAIIIYAALFMGHVTSYRFVGILGFCALFAGMFLDFLSIFNLLLYNFAIAALILTSAYHGVRYFESNSKGHAIAFLTTLTLMSVYRETWSYPFLIVVGGIVVMNNREDWWKVALAAVPSAAWMVKNAVIFGFFSMSSIVGMTLNYNAGRSVYRAFLPDARYDAVVKTLTNERPEWLPLLEGPMRRVSIYESKGYKANKVPRFEEIPALGRFEKSDWWGASNKNAYEYIQLSKDFFQLDLALIKAYPGNYLRNSYVGFLVFLKPAWYWMQPTTTKMDVGSFMPAFVRVPGPDQDMAFSHGVLISKGYGLFPWALLIAVVALVCGVFLLRGWKRTSILYVLLIFAAGILSSILVTNLESNRYKFEIEPLVYVVFWGMLARAALWLVERKNLKGMWLSVRT